MCKTCHEVQMSCIKDWLLMPVQLQGRQPGCLVISRLIQHKFNFHRLSKPLQDLATPRIYCFHKFLIHLPKYAPTLS